MSSQIPKQLQNYLQTQNSNGFQIKDNSKNQFTNTQYRPASQQSNNSRFGSTRLKKFRYDDDEDDKYITKQKQFTVKPGGSRKIFRCTNGVSITDQFATDNKILHYDSYQNQSQSKNFNGTQNSFRGGMKTSKNNFFETSNSQKNNHKYNQSCMTENDSEIQKKKREQRHSESVQNRRQSQQDLTNLAKKQKQKVWNEYVEEEYNMNNSVEKSQIQNNNNNQDQQSQQSQQQQQKQTNEKCFDQDDFDPRIIENMTLEELQEIFPDELLMNKNFNFQQFFDEQPDYFMHLLGYCACTRCKCGICRCDAGQIKLKLLTGFSTTYGRDFFGQSNSISNTKSQNFVSGKIHATKFGGFDQLDKGYSTMYKQDFIKYPNKSVQKEKGKQWVQYEKPQINTTSYGTEFVNWKNYDIKHFKAQKHVSTDARIPFNGNTTYGNSFFKNDLKGLVAPIDTNKHKPSPYPQLQGFDGETTSKYNYKAFKIKPNTTKVEKKQYIPVPTYNGQFRTTGMRDFNGGYDQKCPVNKQKKAIRNQIMKKLEDMRSLKNTSEIRKLEKQIKYSQDHPNEY